MKEKLEEKILCPVNALVGVRLKIVHGLLSQYAGLTKQEKIALKDAEGYFSNDTNNEGEDLFDDLCDYLNDRLPSSWFFGSYKENYGLWKIEKLS